MDSLKRFLSVLESYLDKHTDIIIDHLTWLEWGTDAHVLLGMKLHVICDYERAMSKRTQLRSEGKKVFFYWKTIPTYSKEPPLYEIL